MANKISNLTDAQLAGLLTNMTNGLDGRVTAYGLTAADFTALQNSTSLFNDAVVFSETAEAARKSATQQKKTQKRSTVGVASGIANRVYANPAVSNQMLAEIGLTPRSQGGTRSAPKTPLDLIAAPSANGYVKFTWKRNGNPTRAVFNLQQWQNGAWITISALTRVSETLGGFAPGIEQRFRVVAWLNGQQSQPSNEFTIYDEGGSEVLSLAA